MTPTAAVYDRNQFYLALDISAPKGAVLENGESYWQLCGDTRETSAEIVFSDGALLGMKYR
jgi:hypothetical protein